MCMYASCLPRHGELLQSELLWTVTVVACSCKAQSSMGQLPSCYEIAVGVGTFLSSCKQSEPLA